METFPAAHFCDHTFDGSLVVGVPSLKPFDEGYSRRFQRPMSLRKTCEQNLIAFINHLRPHLHFLASRQVLDAWRGEFGRWYELVHRANYTPQGARPGHEITQPTGLC
jgi:hypothetical protein